MFLAFCESFSLFLAGLRSPRQMDLVQSP